MRRPGLSAILIGLNLGIASAALLCVAAVALASLRGLSDEQALARVGQAGSAALQLVESGDELETVARLLADRPTLAQLIARGTAPELNAYLERYRETSRLGGCGIRVGERWLAVAGVVDVVPLRSGRLLAPSDRGSLVAGAAAAIPTIPTAAAVVTRVLDPQRIARISEEVGLAVRVVPLSADPDSARAELRRRARDSERPALGRVDAEGAYLAVLPLRDAAGTLVGTVETELPSASVSTTLSRLRRRLVLLSLLVAAVGAGISVVVGRRLVQPLEALTAASARIGRGDLTTPIPREATAEVGELAEAMEEMRGRLLDLTAALAEKRGEADAVAAGIAEGVYAVDRERRLRYLNPQTAEMLGVRAEEVIGRFCGDVLNPQDPAGRPCEDRCPIVHARSGENARATEHLLLRDGRRRTVVIASATPVGGGGEETRQFQIVRDETEVEVTRRLRDTVLANISHEFRTPLSAQLASIELLRDRLPELKGEEAANLVLALERGALRLLQLVDNLLESVRIESGQDAVRRQPVALDEVVEEAVELTAPLLSQREQRVDVGLPYPLPGVTGDAPRLVQVFVNLLANAHKFAPAGSTITLGGAVEGPMVRLWVEDEGPGLPADGSTLFERFSRAPGDEPEESGMGLGLWIVKSIVERHGGRVDAGRARRGQGARVSISLPTAVARA